MELGMQRKSNLETRGHYGTYPEVRGQHNRRPESQGQYGAYPDQYTYFERRYVKDLSPYRLEYRPRHGPEWIPGVLQKPTNWSEFTPPQYYRSLPLDHHRYGRIPRRAEKERKRGRDSQRHADTIYDEVDIDRKPAQALSRKEVPGKLEKEHERKKRKEPEEEAAVPQSPKQSIKHRKKKRIIEQPLDADVVYDDWEPLYQVPLPHPERTLDTPRERAPGQENRRRQALVLKPPFEVSDGSQRRKLDPHVLQNSRFKLVYPEGSKEEETLYGDIGRPAKYEWLSGRTYTSDPCVYSWRGSKPKCKRNLMRPPPYVPPPAYNAKHRTFKAQRPSAVWKQQPTKAAKLSGLSLDDQTPLNAHTRAQAQQLKSDRPVARAGQEQNDSLQKTLSQNTTKDDAALNALLQGKREKEAETEKKKRFDSKICKSLMGWKLTQGFSTWAGSSKRKGAEATSQPEKMTQSSLVKSVDDDYETIEWETGVPKSKSSLDHKSRNTSPPTASRAGVKPGEGRAFCLVSNHIEETIPKAKRYTLPRAAHEHHWHDQDMGVGPEEQRILPTEIDKQKPTRGRHFGRKPDEAQLWLKEEKKPHRSDRDYDDYEDIYSYLPVYRPAHKGHWDKSPYEWCYSYPPDQPQFPRNRTAFQELSSNSNLIPPRNRQTPNYPRDRRSENQAAFQYTDGRVAFYSQTLPRERASRGRAEESQNFSDRRRRSLEPVASLTQERSQGENSEERIWPKQETSFPRWTEPGKAKTLPRQTGVLQNPFDKVHQEFRATYESPRSVSNRSKGRPHGGQSPAWIEASNSHPQTPSAGQQDSDGMFVIDATCVLIRAEYIFPPKTEQVKYLSPSWEGTGQRGQNVPNDKRDLGHGRGNEPNLYSQGTRENKPALMSPSQKRILNKQPGRHQEEAGLEANHGAFSAFHGFRGMEMSEPCPASDTHLIQERASRIIGLSVTDLEPLVENRRDNTGDSERIEEPCSKHSTEISNVFESSQGDVFSRPGKSTRTGSQPSTHERLDSRLRDQQAPLHSSSELGVRKKALLYERHFGQFHLSPESGKIVQMGGNNAVRSSLSSEMLVSVGNVGSGYSRLEECDGHDKRPLTKETSAQNREVCEESDCDKEKSLATAVTYPLSKDQLDELGQKQKHNYSDEEVLPKPRTKADEEGRLDLEDSDVWQKASGAPVEHAVVGEDGPGHINLPEELPKASAEAKEEVKYLNNMPLMEMKVQEPPVDAQPSPGNQDEGNKCFPQEDEQGLVPVLPITQSNSLHSKGGQSGSAIRQPDSKDTYSEKSALMKPSSKRRGFYAKDLHEAVSRIRRHTAPDSDTDEEQEHKAPVGSKPKAELLQREQQEKEAPADSSSSSNDSDATVIMRVTDVKKEPELGLEGPILRSPTEAVGRWLVSSGEHQAAALSSSESKSSLDLESDSSTSSSAARAEDQEGVTRTSDTGHPGANRKSGSDLSACIEEILQELNRAEIDFFGTSGEEGGCLTEAAGPPAAEKTHVDP